MHYYSLYNTIILSLIPLDRLVNTTTPLLDKTRQVTVTPLKYNRFKLKAMYYNMSFCSISITVVLKFANILSLQNVYNQFRRAE